MEQTSSHYKPLENKAAFEQLILKDTSKVAVVVFTADKFANAQILDSFIEELAQDYTNFNFFRVDVEQTKKYASELGVQRIPTLLFFRNGEIIYNIQEMLPFSLLKRKLERLKN